MTEEIVGQILSKHPEISRQEILEKWHKEKKKTNGLLSDEVILRKIAAELGVETLKEIETPALSIQDLISGLNDVSVVGRVVAVFQPKTFGADGGGKVASFLIVDRDSILRVILWNEKADFIESGQVKTGKIVRVSHGYTKEGFRGKIELHLGERGEIRIDPKNVNSEDYPTISKFVTKISEITAEQANERLNIAGVVREIFPVASFERKDSTCGKVMRFILADETGKIPVVIWNQKVDEFEKKSEKATNLRVIGGKLKEAMGGGFEVHVNSRTYLEIVEPSEGMRKIADLRIGMNHVRTEGEVVSRPIVRKVKTSKAKLVRVAVFELRDETGRIWVSAWREHARNVRDLNVSQKVRIDDAYVKKGFGGQPELSTRKTTSITVHPTRTE